MLFRCNRRNAWFRYCKTKWLIVTFIPFTISISTIQFDNSHQALSLRKLSHSATNFRAFTLHYGPRTSILHRLCCANSPEAVWHIPVLGIMRTWRDNDMKSSWRKLRYSKSAAWLICTTRGVQTPNDILSKPKACSTYKDWNNSSKSANSLLSAHNVVNVNRKDSV